MSAFNHNSVSHKRKNLDLNKGFWKDLKIWVNCCGYYFSSNIHKFSCPKSPKCYICLVGGDHDTLNCSDRLTDSNWFLPKIDQAMLLRFFKLFDNAELFLNYANLEPFKIMNKFNDEMLEKHKDSIIVLKCNMEKIGPMKMTKVLSLENLFFKVKYLRLFNVECSAEDFFRNLSPMTNQIRLQIVKITPKIKFFDVLVKLPQLIQIYLIETNIEIPKNWPRLILNYCKNDLEKIAIKIKNFDFNIEDLVNIMKKHSSKNVYVVLQVETPNPDNFKMWLFQWSSFKQKLLSQHFNQIKEKVTNHPVLAFKYLLLYAPVEMGYFILRNNEVE